MPNQAGPSDQIPVYRPTDRSARDSLPITGSVGVRLELYDEARGRMAFSVSFPDGTGAWCHNRDNVRALIRAYEFVQKTRVTTVWHGAAAE